MHFVIIGNGITGTTAARFIRKKSDHKITMISDETEHPYSRTALLYIYMGHMKYENTKLYEDYFWEKNRIELKKARIESIDAQNHQLTTEKGETISYDKLLIATGSSPNKFGWKGQDLNGVQGLYHFQDLEKMEQMTPKIKRAVIIGGGLIGIEMAEMFRSRNIAVSMLVRESSFWNSVLPAEESQMINQHILEHHIDLRLNAELDSIEDNGNGNVKSILTKSGEKIDCEFVGLTVGVHPNIDFLKNTELEIDRGILVNDFQETNLPNVYSAGDCAQMKTPKEGRRGLEQVWYTGKMQGKCAALNMCGIQEEYNPQIWFNSAKFLDIEYQTYGTVLAKMSENEDCLIFQTDKKLIRIVFDKNTLELIGINNFGVRLRHLVCDKWLREKTSIKTVVENFGLANFDPEFFKTYEEDLVKVYNEKFSSAQIQLKTKKGLKKVLSFLNFK